MQIEEQEGAAERPTKRKKLLRGAAPTHSMSDTPQRVTMSPQKRPLKRKFDEFVAQMAEFGDNNSLSSTRRDAARVRNVLGKFDSTPQGQLSILTEVMASLERAEKKEEKKAPSNKNVGRDIFDSGIMQGIGVAIEKIKMLGKGGRPSDGAREIRVMFVMFIALHLLVTGGYQAGTQLNEKKVLVMSHAPPRTTDIARCSVRRLRGRSHSLKGGREGSSSTTTSCTTLWGRHPGRTRITTIDPTRCTKDT